jgi:hypothetical protein
MVGRRQLTPTLPIRERVDPGSIVVVVRAPGHEPFERRVDVAATEVAAIDVVLVAERSPVDDGELVRDPHRVTIARGLAIGGTASILGAGVLALVARDTADPIASVEGKVAIAGAVTGAALLGGAIAIYVTAPRRRTTIAIVPAPGGFAIVGRF